MSTSRGDQLQSLSLGYVSANDTFWLEAATPRRQRGSGQAVVDQDLIGFDNEEEMDPKDVKIEIVRLDGTNFQR